MTQPSGGWKYKGDIRQLLNWQLKFRNVQIYFMEVRSIELLGQPLC